MYILLSEVSFMCVFHSRMLCSHVLGSSTFLYGISLYEYLHLNFFFNSIYVPYN